MPSDNSKRKIAPPSDDLKEEWRRRRGRLPHWQFGGSVYFVTFRSARGVLPASALHLAREELIERHGSRYDLIFGVLMPDHVHLLLKPEELEPGLWVDLSNIMKGIKGATARKINLALGTTGTVWQKETFDRLIRDEEELYQKWNYMFWNPKFAGLVEDPDDYLFFVCPVDLAIR